jgi:esterase/lipase superfamily enzyme
MTDLHFHLGRRVLAALLLVVTAAAQSQTRELDYCARGLSQAPNPPFTQTLRVKLTLGGAALDGPDLKTFVEQLIRAKLWNGQADQVFVEPYDAEECSASLGNFSEIAAEVTEAEVAAIKAAAGRDGSTGNSVFAAIGDLARRAAVKLDLSGDADTAAKRWLKVYYTSNRNATGAATTAAAFGAERVDTLSYGAVEVAISHQKEMRDIESPAVLKIDKATSLDDFEVATKLQPMTLEAWRAELKRRAARFEQPGVLLFIHGFNVSFAAAAQRSAQLAYDLAFPGPTVFLSWPSDASVIKYLRDGRDARNSRQAVAKVLSELAGLLPAGPVYVIAHSMGNRLLTEGYAQLLEDQPGRARAFREIVMAAPDVDQEDFRLNFAPRMLSSGPRFTLYASEHDLALGSSELLQGGKRLGFGGKDLFVERGVDSVAPSAVSKEFFSLNHSYFGDTTTVLADIFHLIRRRLPPAERPHLQAQQRSDGKAWTLVVGQPPR